MSAHVIAESRVRVIPTKTCPTCNRDLPRGEFGICRARADGRNLYCKACIRKRISESRAALRERRAAQKRLRDEADAFLLDNFGDDGFTSETKRRKQQDHCIEGIFEPKPEHFNQPWPTVRTQTFVEMVFGSVQKLGKPTQNAIVTDTKLPKETVGLAIADLLLWKKQIATEGEGLTRVYFERKCDEA